MQVSKHKFYYYGWSSVVCFWSTSEDKMPCLDALYDTIYNILDTCDMRAFRSVAMPAISAGIIIINVSAVFHCTCAKVSLLSQILVTFLDFAEETKSCIFLLNFLSPFPESCERSCYLIQILCLIWGKQADSWHYEMMFWNKKGP